MLLLLCLWRFRLVLTLAVPNPRRVPAVKSRKCDPLARLPQTLLFRDPVSGVCVHLVGTMHYNPHSVRRAEYLVQKYCQEDQLESLVLESCPTRWMNIQQKHPPGSLLRGVLDNEFQASFEAALEHLPKLQPVLADEDIDANDKRVNDVFLSSLKDYANPLGGGWTRISEDLLRGYKESIDPRSCEGTGTEDAEYLDALDLLDPGLAAGAPVSLLRYTTSSLVRKPLKGTLLLVWIGGLVYLLLTRVGFADGGVTLVLSSVFGFLMSLSLGIPLLGRVFLFALLGERNVILAKNIRKECLRIATEAVTRDDANNESRDNCDPVCVVILGLAHCNGVKRELSLSHQDF